MITENTTTDRASLFEEFQDICDRGYDIDCEEWVKGMWCVAAPIVPNDGEVYGAVSVSGPKSRVMGEGFEQEIPEMIMRIANVVEVNLTYS